MIDRNVNSIPGGLTNNLSVLFFNFEIGMFFAIITK